MKRPSDKPAQTPPVLYHAVSSYQLLEVMLHRMVCHPDARAVLLLPDFITEKYPQYQKLAKRRFFDEVYLFPYLKIFHTNEEQITRDVSHYFRALVPYELDFFQKIYIAGAHFYFTLYPIAKNIPFYFFEDAAGMLSRSHELYRALLVNYPVHAEIARRRGLFDGTNPLIQKIICLKTAQTIDVSGPKYLDFSVERTLAQLPGQDRNRLVRFFLKRRFRTRAQAIVLTQHFANLGMMEVEAQKRLYASLSRRLPPDLPVILKKHPDDRVDYAQIFPRAKVLRQVFPAELLPYAFRKKPEYLYTFDSTSCENLKEHFTIRKFERDQHVQ